jgi:hypothetical protein
MPFTALTGGGDSGNFRLSWSESPFFYGFTALGSWLLPGPFAFLAAVSPLK